MVYSFGDPPRSSGLSRVMRVVLSTSTLDSPREHEWLVRHVFPEIRRLCAERGVDFTEDDPRIPFGFGELQCGRGVIACLDDLQRTQAYYLCVVADRYGHVPDPTGFEAMDGVRSRYQLLCDAAREGRSLYDLEITGVMRIPSMTQRSLFYLSGHTSEPPFSLPARSDVKQNRLSALKERVESNGHRARRYSSREEFIACMVNDLRGLLESDFPPTGIESAYQRERIAQGEFAESLCRVYVPDVELLSELDAAVIGEGRSVVVGGESGDGKSTLIANWCARFRERHPEITLIQYHVGAGVSGGDAASVVRYLIGEASGAFGMPLRVPDSAEAMIARLPEMLVVPEGHALVLAIDALDQLSPEAQSLDWLPEHLPPFVRVIASATPGQAYRALLQRGWHEVRVRPLAPADRLKIIRGHLGSFGAGLDVDDLATMVSNATPDAPLLAILEILREIQPRSADERADVIRFYAAANGTHEFFRLVLERLRQAHDPVLVREVLTVLAISRRGLTLFELLQYGRSIKPRLTEAAILRCIFGLGSHLRQADGYLRFFHDGLRRVVEEEYLSSEQSRRRAHRRLAYYFASVPMCDRAADELPWQFLHAGMWSSLAQCFLDVDLFMCLSRGIARYELARYWSVLHGRVDSPAAGLLASLAKLERNERANLAIRSAYADFLQMVNEFDAAQTIFEENREIVEDILDRYDEQYAFALRDLGRLYRERAMFTEALGLTEQALQSIEGHFGGNHPETAATHETLATVLYDLKKYDRSEQGLRNALRIYRESGAESLADVARILCSLGAVFHQQEGRRDDARVAFAEALEITMRIYGPDTAPLAEIYNNLGAVDLALGDGDSAIEQFKRALAISRATFGGMHSAVMLNLNNLGIAFRRDNRFAEAEACYEEALSIAHAVLPEDNPLTANVCQTLAVLQKMRGNLGRAEELQRTALGICLRRFGVDHVTTAEAGINLGSILKSRKAFVEAAEHYRRYIGPLSDGRVPQQASLLEALGGLLDLGALLTLQGDEHRNLVAGLYRSALRARLRHADAEDDIVVELRSRLKALGR
ncbi:MAG: ATP-binding protein [Bacteroidetes bacterium]|nr:ATP-binding protein [Bacteroidota bacterium]